MNALIMLSKLSLLAEATGDTNAAKDFVDAIISSVTSNISLTMVATIVGAIIAAGIVAVVGWKYARKAYRFIKNAITGREGSPM